MADLNAAKEPNTLAQLRGSLLESRLGILLMIAAALVGVILVAIIEYTEIQQHADATATRNAERLSLSWATYLSGNLPEIEELLSGAPVSDEQRDVVDRLTTFPDLFRFKLFGANGNLMLVSDNIDLPPETQSLGKHNPTANKVIQTGIPYTSYEDGRAKPDRPDVYAESYVPILRNGRIIGVAEVYVDQTADTAAVFDDFVHFQITSGLALLAALAIPGAILIIMVLRLRAMNADLKHARDEALAAEKAKSEFLATMSHEIRTPMNGVIGTADLMAGTNLDSRQRTFVEIIQSSSKALLDIINDILDFSKVEAGQVPLIEEPFSLKRIAIEPARMVTEAAASKGIELAIRVAPGTPRRVIGDVDRLRQIVANLVGNAVKFTERGEVIIDISTTPPAILSEEDIRSAESTADSAAGDEAGERIWVSVRDTGPGIPHSDQSRVFERFSQVDSSTTRHHEGTGLGLAISSGLVRQMGGRIGLVSTPGAGSTFWFMVPLARAEEDSRARQVPVIIRGMSVLVADDNATNRFILDELLASWGLETTLVSNGAEAVKKAQRAAALGRPYSLALLDHHMPGMDGEDVLSELRQSPDCAALPVILLTSILEGSSLARCTGDLGLNGCMVKPAGASDLLDKIMDVITTARAGATQPAATTDAPAPARTAGQTAGQPAATPAPETDTPLSAHAPAAHSDGQQAQVDVLVVEDNAVNGMLTQHMLGGMDLTLATAENGEEAVEMFEDLHPSVVLMDISMPIMNGYEATDAIRAIEQRNNLPRTPIIGTTAHAMPGDRQRCLDAGMDDYLSKPLTVDGLQSAVTAALDGSKTGSSADPDRAAAE
jgi:signal transduction histidine kinase/DNA-binding response OmpR family regulator